MREDSKEWYRNKEKKREAGNIRIDLFKKFKDMFDTLGPDGKKQILEELVK